LSLETNRLLMGEGREEGLSPDFGLKHWGRWRSRDGPDGCSHHPRKSMQRLLSESTLCPSAPT
jgi:hypothetical protein